MSDFGFDAFALDSVDEAGRAHPLEIARDLIAKGRPRSALDVLSDHHAELGDDPEYLLVCAEAWLGDGDALRAQQALLGAARLAPEDPRPLWGLAELFSELDQHDKASRARARADALDARKSQASIPSQRAEPDLRDDLIAVAERRERTTRAMLTPRQALVAVLAFAAIAALVAGIAWITTPQPAIEARPAPLPPSATPAPADVPATTAEKAEPASAAQPVALEEPREPAPRLIETPWTEAPTIDVAATVPRPTPATPVLAPAPSPRPSPKARATRPLRPREEPAAKTTPDPSAVQAELGSMTPEELTARADALHAEGHTGVAASYYRKALEIDPDYAPALVGVGRSTLRAKKYSEAMQHATRALELARGVDARPGLEASAIYQLGRVHYERGERDAARRLFRQSISLPGTPAEAWFYLGEALSSDNSPAAREAYEQYLERVPEGSLADRARRAIR